MTNENWSPLLQLLPYRQAYLGFSDYSNEDGRWKKIDAVEYNLTIWVLFCEHTEPSMSHQYCLLCNALLIMKRMDGGVSNLQIEVGQWQ